jgi:DNA-binding PadR family transcriptional regulator
LNKGEHQPIILTLYNTDDGIMARHRLGEFETSVLLAVVKLQGRGYGVSIADEIERRAGKPVSFGAVYATLDRLQKKGLISSELGRPSPERGGKPKRFYRIEAPGERALLEARALAEQMWAGVPSIGAPA